jgi:hypothetical protein
MSKTSIIKARRALVAAGLAAFESTPRLVYAQPLGLLNQIPNSDSRKIPRGSNMDPRGSNMDPSLYIESKGSIKTEQRAPTREGADASRRGDCLDLDNLRIKISRTFQAAKWESEEPIFPNLSDRGALELAGFCDTPEDVDRWVRSEALGLSGSDTENPAGLLLYLAENQGSRPGDPSAWEQSRRRKIKGGHRFDPYTPAPWERIRPAGTSPEKEPPKSPKLTTGEVLGIVGAKTTTKRENDKMNEAESQGAYDEARDLAETAETAREWEAVKRAAAYSMTMAAGHGFADIESKSFQLRMRAANAQEGARECERVAAQAPPASSWIPENDQSNKAKMRRLHSRLSKSLEMNPEKEIQE